MRYSRCPGPAKDSDPDTPLILISSDPPDEEVVEALKNGARDYLQLKNIGRLGSVIDDQICSARERRIERQRLSTARLILRETSLPVWVYDLDTLQFLEVNEAAIRHYGYSREEFLSMTLKAIRPEEDIPRLLAKILPADPVCYKAGTWRHRKKDGTLMSVEIIAHPIAFAGRRAEAVFAIDVTEQSRMETEMAERNRLAELTSEIGSALGRATNLRQGLQDCAAILTRRLDAALTRIWTLNEAEGALELQASAGLYAQIDGDHARVPVGRSRIGHIALEGQPQLTNAVPDDPWTSDREWAIRESMVGFAGYPLVIKDRVVGVVASFSRHPLTESAAQVLGLISGSLAQFIDRKRAKLALRAREERFRTAFEYAPFGMLLAGPDRKLLQVNATLCRMLGYSPEELIGRTWDAITHPADLAVSHAVIENLEQEHFAEFEKRYLHKAGEHCLGSGQGLDRAGQRNRVGAFHRPHRGHHGAAAGRGSSGRIGETLSPLVRTQPGRCLPYNPGWPAARLQ